MKAHKNSYFSKLSAILEKGSISPKVREAIEGIIKAVEDKDLDLARELSVSKSLIVGEIDQSDDVHAFQEDEKVNKKLFGDSVYSILGSVNFELSMRTDAVPSGMIILGIGGVVAEREDPKRLHPVVERINYEMDVIYGRV